MNDRYTFEEARRKDQDDSMSKYRNQFMHADTREIYLDGNSLGRLPIATQKIIERTVDHQWGERLIRSWNEDWYIKNQVIGDKIACIAGASAGEVVVTDTTSVNLYKLAYSALKYKQTRKKIITDELNFPSDIYILQGLVKEFGDEYALEIIRSRDGVAIYTEDVLSALDENTALVSFSHVAFKSSFRYPMREITHLVHEKGAMMLWDLSHSIGAVPGELNESDTDLAVGCTYKYLNGGPGSPAFLYVKKELQDQLVSPIWGWFGQKDPFKFSLEYQPAEGISRFLAGTPPILSLAAIEPTLDMMIEIGMNEIRRKSLLQTSYLIELAEYFLFPYGFSIGSPSEANDRGSHVSFQHKEAYRICKALIDPNLGNEIIIPDFREPDNVRIGITPLYTSYIDLYLAVKKAELILKENLYEKYSVQREIVT